MITAINNSIAVHIGYTVEKVGNMTSSNYKKAISRISSKRELERLLSIIENDEEISDRKYYNLRYIIINKIYQ